MGGWCLLLQGDAIERLRGLDADSVHCAITSPPYFGHRDYEMDGQLGLERTHLEYVERLVAVLEEVRRVLRPDGTMWLNLGDSYATDGGAVGQCPGGGVQGERFLRGGMVDTQPNRMKLPGLKRGDLIGIPWRVALALQAAGWYLRSDVVWQKPACMPESVRTRPTKSHESVFLLAKSARYFYDQAAVLEPFADGRDGEGRNRRTVWTIHTETFKPVNSTMHYAVMPQALAEVCVRAGTSAHGVCAACQVPWRRVIVRREAVPTGVEVGGYPGRRDNGVRERDPSGAGGNILARVIVSTGEWEPGCVCSVGIVPATVLDPFAGSGTTGVVALMNGRNFIGVDLNPEYIELARNRISGLQLEESPVLEVA